MPILTQLNWVNFPTPNAGSTMGVDGVVDNTGSPNPFWGYLRVLIVDSLGNSSEVGRTNIYVVTTISFSLRWSAPNEAGAYTLRLQILDLNNNLVTEAIQPFTVPAPAPPTPPPPSPPSPPSPPPATLTPLLITPPVTVINGPVRVRTTVNTGSSGFTGTLRIYEVFPSGDTLERDSTGMGLSPYSSYPVERSWNAPSSPALMRVTAELLVGSTVISTSSSSYIIIPAPSFTAPVITPPVVVPNGTVRVQTTITNVGTAEFSGTLHLYEVHPSGATADKYTTNITISPNSSIQVDRTWNAPSSSGLVQVIIRLLLDSQPVSIATSFYTVQSPPPIRIPSFSIFNEVIFKKQEVKVEGTVENVGTGGFSGILVIREGAIERERKEISIPEGSTIRFSKTWEAPEVVGRKTLIVEVLRNSTSVARREASYRVKLKLQESIPGILLPSFIPFRDIVGFLSFYKPGLEDHVVNNLYATILGRKPDSEGYNFYMRYLSSTKDEIRVFIDFSRGAEGELRGRRSTTVSLPGLVPSVFPILYFDIPLIVSSYKPGAEELTVRLLYATVLRRSPDEEGFRYHVSRLSSHQDPVRLFVDFAIGAERELRERIG